MRWFMFGTRYPVQDVEGGEGGGGAAVAEDPNAGAPDGGQDGEPKKPESTVKREKKLSELRESIDKGEPLPKAEAGKSPGPVRTPKKEDTPKAADGEKPKGEKAKDGDTPAAKKEGEKPAEKASEEAPSTVKLALPGRQLDDEDVEFELPTQALEEAGVDVKQLTDRVAQLRKGFLRGHELLPAKQEIAAQKAELDELETALKEDPVAFLTSRIEKPELHEKIVERLLTQLPDEAFARVLKLADDLSQDPTKRENARLKATLDESDRRARLQERTGTRKADLDEARKIGQSIADVIAETELGEDLEDERAERLFDYAVQRLIAHAQKNKITKLDPSTVPDLLQELGVLDDFGLTRGQKREKKPNAADEKKKPAAEGAQDPRERDKRRREATTTPSGDGAAAAAGDRPPKGQTFKERMSWLRKKVSS